MKKMFLGMFIILIVTWMGTISKAEDNWQEIGKNLEKSGFDVESVSVEGHALVNTNLSLEDIAKRVFILSKLEGDLKVVEEKGELILTNGAINIKVKNLDKENLKYVSFTLSQYNLVENINNIKDSITKGFKGINVIPTFSYLIQGKILKNMGADEMKIKAREILLMCGCVNIGGINDRNLVSYVGFSPLIQEKIKDYKNYTNLNLALRNIKEEGITYFWMGSPVIATEY